VYTCAINQAKRFKKTVEHAGVAHAIAQETKGAWGQYGGIGWIAQATYRSRDDGKTEITIDLSESSPHMSLLRVNLERLLIGAKEVPVPESYAPGAEKHLP
jgi:hypothetical protein